MLGNGLDAERLKRTIPKLKILETSHVFWLTSQPAQPPHPHHPRPYRPAHLPVCSPAWDGLRLPACPPTCFYSFQFLTHHPTNQATNQPVIRPTTHRQPSRLSHTQIHTLLCFWWLNVVHYTYDVEAGWCTCTIHEHNGMGAVVRR